MDLFSRALKTTKGKPPKMPVWRYDEGSGDAWLAETLELEEEGLADPKSYTYSYPKLAEIETKLNTSKSRLDYIFANDKTTKEWQTFIRQFRDLESLRGERGILAQKYQAEIVTNAWMKMYEIMHYAKGHLDAIESKPRKTPFYSLHVAEAPGNFMLAVNQYLQNYCPKIVQNGWVWTANSYRESGNGGYLGDSYNLMRDYSNNWYWGPDMNGDITSPAMIRGLSLRPKVQLFTSDVKYVPKNERNQIDYANEETINHAVDYGHLACAWASMDKGLGVATFKEFSHCTAPGVARLYLMSLCFTQLYVTKPMSSRTLNSETYITGFDFTGSEKTLDSLVNYLDMIRFNPNPPCPLSKDQIPDEFVTKVTSIESELAVRQIKEMDETLLAFKKYQETGKIEKNTDLVSVWLKANPIMPLTRNKMIKN